MVLPTGRDHDFSPPPPRITVASLTSALPAAIDYLVVGAGVHGLSTAYHLARRLKAKGEGDGRNVVVVDKTGVGSGASGMACGVIRNNYYQPAMRELMAHSVAIWESDMEAFSYHPVGYVQLGPEAMGDDIATIHKEQQAIGYPSTHVVGAKDCREYMLQMFDDWQAEGITSILHEQRGGFANNRASMFGLAAKAEAEGVQILLDTEVLGFGRDSQTGAVRSVQTTRGDVEVGYVVVGVGPWVKLLWDLLELPSRITIRGADGTDHHDVPMWSYWCLQEGTVGVHPDYLQTNEGGKPPVLHVDTDVPLFSDVDGSLITDEMWGIYYKPDTNFNGVQGGAMPYRVETDPDDVAVDPYGPASPDFVVGEEFAEMWTSALAFCHKRFEGHRRLYRDEPSGGIGAFTPDSFPVFDVFADNVYVIADSNHGYKMIGVGELVAEEICGGSSPLLEPFRFSRYREGALHPVSHSPFPWS